MNYRLRFSINVVGNCDKGGKTTLLIQRWTPTSLPPSLPPSPGRWVNGEGEGMRVGPGRIFPFHTRPDHMPIGHAHNHTPVARGAGAASALLQTTSGEERRIAQYNKGCKPLLYCGRSIT